jgi:hypothetical protein
VHPSSWPAWQEPPATYDEPTQVLLAVRDWEQLTLEIPVPR